MSRTRLDLVLPATPVVPGVSSRLSLADVGLSGSIGDSCSGHGQDQLNTHSMSRQEFMRDFAYETETCCLG